jgi:hypothetical protein
MGSNEKIRISNIEVRNKETNLKRILLGFHSVIISNAVFISVPSLFILPAGLFRTSKIGGRLFRQNLAGQPVEYAGLLLAVRLDVVP